MKIFVPVTKPVKTCLLASGTGLLALVLSACSQTAEPEADAETSALIAEPAEPEKKTSPTLPRVEKPVKKEQQASVPVPGVSTPSSADATTPGAAGVTALTSPAFPPVELPVSFTPVAPGKRIARVSVPGPCVAVTFDDGPSASLTPQVLDIFNRHGAHATFFVLGRNAAHNRSVLARAVAEGHEVGSHTWSHINMRASSLSTIFSELDRTNAVIEQATGQRPRVMRPPYGSVTTPLINAVFNRYGTPAIMWDVDTNDWRKPGVQTVINHAVGNAKPGSIILLHDIHASTLAAVEGVVTGLQARGFKLVTVSELIDMGRRAAGVGAPAPASEAAPAAPVPESSVAEVSLQPALPAPEAAPAPQPPAEDAGGMASPQSQPAPQPVVEEPAVAAENPREYDDLF